MITLDELLEKDKRREEDGFKRKIRIGRIVKPGTGGKDKIIIVPTTVEEKFVHDEINLNQEPGEGEPTGGTGEGEEGDIIGEQPVRPEEGEDGEEGSGEGPGEGKGSEHELESNAYELGKVLSQDFQLPNLKDKGKKRTLARYVYDLTDKNRGVGQILDKKATLKRIVETNITLGNIPDVANIDPTKFIISPQDMIYRILSREKDYESQALVFFLRDYSGSMGGKVTQTVVSQHVMLYSWLLYQYEKQVETRFILHDTEAKEVSDFYKYYSYKVAGGTKVFTAFKMVNDIVERENLARDYNIYVFHGTDGDDWDKEGKQTIVEIEKMMNYVSRIGISIVEHSYVGSKQTEVEKYLKASNLLTKHSTLIKLDVMDENSDDSRIIQGIKRLIS
ncbi:DUF444 family protein [Desulfobacula toluolica]|uniref:Conserved uncharacterized protein, DUF444 n=1 Tax=Desulfobacula toluolica (strain DSM 7467 / Tol2) TaxID=651182 RepID=K0N991_DESTT|nr:DUF444 family protein [Desulfobacula toluolica]CCK80509.1 conserved uncharacterized protein, DUF444 [Desulfobacula toluolica Tol2]